MNARHRRTLLAIFASPPPATIAWRDVEALLVALGADRQHRAGSRIAFELNGRTLHMHVPHPANEIGRKTIRDVKDFLDAAGVTP